MTLLFEDNIYYHPEKYGLEVVGELDPRIPYEFHTVAVWKDTNGLIYWCSDSGCSCPVPFENTNFESLATINSFDDFREFCDYLDDWYSWSYACSESDRFNADRVELKMKVGRVLRGVE